MKIAITGSSGYIGKHLIRILINKGYELRFIPHQMLYGATDALITNLQDVDTVINLAGAPILQRWTETNKIIIYNSRVITTKNLCAAINALPSSQRPKTFISASAVGIYRAMAKHDENSSNFAESFAGKVVMDWEDASLQLAPNIRRVIFRTGLVLGKESQIMKKALPAFKAGLGGWIGNGMQAFPFIHIDDVVKAYCEAIDKQTYSGIYNLVTPEQITNKHFSRRLAHFLHRPVFLFVPSPILNLIYREASEMLTTSAEVIPSRLISLDFSYRYPDIDSTLVQITT